METKDNAEELAFAECVRRQALRIATLCLSGKAEKAAESALALCIQTARRKRELLGLPEPEPVDVDHDEPGYDLGAFNAEYGPHETDDES